MKLVDEYRDPELAQRLLDRLRRLATRPWTVMEVCGGQTHAFVKSGLIGELPDNVRLSHGPGCPVCVTPGEEIDQAIALSLRPEVTLCSFGDMLRVPGAQGDLQAARAQGADVRVVYSPLDALALAKRLPDRQVIFFAVGFETTAPATALAAWQSQREAIGNFRLLVSHVLVPPAIEQIARSPANQVQGFLAAGHVCAIMGYEQYLPIATRYRIPIVVTGFEPIDLLEGLCMLVEQLERGENRVENQYARVVRQAGNVHAQKITEEVYEPCDRAWRGLGIIPQSGLRLREAYRALDARTLLGDWHAPMAIENECRAGEVLMGTLKPRDCPAFGARCTPEHPLGAPMVSSEGACAAYYHFGRVSAKGAIV